MIYESVTGPVLAYVAEVGTKIFRTKQMPETTKITTKEKLSYR
jgi:hypothetical protein